MGRQCLGRWCRCICVCVHVCVCILWWQVCIFLWNVEKHHCSDGWVSLQFPMEWLTSAAASVISLHGWVVRSEESNRIKPLLGQMWLNGGDHWFLCCNFPLYAVQFCYSLMDCEIYKRAQCVNVEVEKKISLYTVARCQTRTKNTWAQDWRDGEKTFHSTIHSQLLAIFCAGRVDL